MKRPRKVNYRIPEYDLGGFLGQTVGSLIPGVGSLLGPAIGAIMGKSPEQQRAEILAKRGGELQQANQQFAATNQQFQPNIPTFPCGGRMKKYPTGGELTNPLPIQLDTTINDTMSPARKALMKYKDINNPQLYSDLQSKYNSGEDINPTLGGYFSALKGDNTTSTPYTQAFLNNVNKQFGSTSGTYYNPESPSFNAIDPDRYPDVYKMLQSKYKTSNSQQDTSSVSGKRLLGSGTMGVGSQQYAQGGKITTLDPLNEKDFLKWYSKYSELTGNNSNPDDPEHYYDYRGYWKDTGGSMPTKRDNYHLPDTYKLKGHPSYYRTDEESHSQGMYGKTESKYAHGGYAVDNRGFANSELEDKEVYRTPQGGMYQVNGASHAEGGEAMNLPQGTEILGKNPVPYTDKTFKEYGQKLMRDYNKFTKILDNKPTGIAKKSAERMLSKVHSGFTNLMNMQESLKPQEEQTQEYAKGGYIKGNTYDIGDDEIQQLINMGYKIQYV